MRMQAKGYGVIRGHLSTFKGPGKCLTDEQQLENHQSQLTQNREGSGEPAVLILGILGSFIGLKFRG